MLFWPKIVGLRAHLLPVFWENQLANSELVAYKLLVTQYLKNCWAICANSFNNRKKTLYSSKNLYCVSVNWIFNKVSSMFIFYLFYITENIKKKKLYFFYIIHHSLFKYKILPTNLFWYFFLYLRVPANIAKIQKKLKPPFFRTHILLFFAQWYIFSAEAFE